MKSNKTRQHLWQHEINQDSSFDNMKQTKQNNTFDNMKQTKQDNCFDNMKSVSEWLLFNANSTIFQLYHGKNKLIFNEMMTRPALF
jgi:hypothetical protein